MVAIVPNPVVMLPLLKAPVPVIFPCTAVGSVWLKLGTPDESVTNTLLLAEPVTCMAEVPLP